MPDKIIRVGIAGYGRSGCDIHALWLKQAPGQYKIAAVADQLPERRADAKRDFDCSVYEDYRTMLLAGGFDLFINAMPSHLHPQGTIDAFRAGFNVVCEKPNAWKVADFDRMVAASKKAKKLFMPFQNSRFFPFFRKIREIIASGVLGEIIHIRINWSGFGRRWDWQTLQATHGGNLLNTGPHLVDHAVMLFGNEMPKVFAVLKSVQPFGGDAEDFAMVTLHGKRAPVIEILLSSYLAYPLGDQYNISGKYGGLTGGQKGLKWRYFDPAKAPVQTFWKPWSDNRKYCSEALPWVEESWEPPASDLDAFQHNSRAFYNSVYEAMVNGAALVVKPAEVRRQIMIMEASHRQNPLPKKVRIWPPTPKA